MDEVEADHPYPRVVGPPRPFPRVKRIPPPCESINVAGRVARVGPGPQRTLVSQVCGRNCPEPLEANGLDLDGEPACFTGHGTRGHPTRSRRIGSHLPQNGLSPVENCLGSTGGDRDWVFSHHTWVEIMLKYFAMT